MISKKHRRNSLAERIPNNSWILRFIVAVIFGLVFTAASTIHACDGKGPLAGVKPLDQNGRMQISPADRCPVCGMKVIRYPKFASAIQLRNRATFYFCSTGCMIRSWMHPEIYLAATAAERKLPVVQEYFTGREVDARNVIFVFGSDVIGPMGPALVPVLDENYLKVFKQRHGAKSQFLLNDMNDDKWFEMTGRKIGK
jgi:nitrous oxide reductase accessory protein NosL